MIDWSPHATSVVNALAVASETIYSGGGFRTFNGLPCKSLAAIGTDGTLRDWNPRADDNPNELRFPYDDVYALAMTDDALLVGGPFLGIGCEVLPRFATLPLATDSN